MWRIFHGVLLVPYNIALDLNNFMSFQRKWLQLQNFDIL
jgi:hypothetical protein